MVVEMALAGNPETASQANPERIPITQPRVARNELPWVKT